MCCSLSLVSDVLICSAFHPDCALKSASQHSKSTSLPAPPAPVPAVSEPLAFRAPLIECGSATSLGTETTLMCDAATDVMEVADSSTMVAFWEEGTTESIALSGTILPAVADPAASSSSSSAASVPVSSPQTADDPKWVCPDCKARVHACFICGVRSPIGSSAGMVVLRLRCILSVINCNLPSIVATHAQGQQ